MKVFENSKCEMKNIFYVVFMKVHHIFLNCDYFSMNNNLPSYARACGLLKAKAITSDRHT